MVNEFWPEREFDGPCVDQSPRSKRISTPEVRLHLVRLLTCNMQKILEGFPSSGPFKI